MKPMKEIYLVVEDVLGYRTFPETNRRCGGYQVGYANGNIANPTYQQVCTGTTDFAKP